jgi:putative membrane protein
MSHVFLRRAALATATFAIAAGVFAQATTGNTKPSDNNASHNLPGNASTAGTLPGSVGDRTPPKLAGGDKAFIEKAALHGLAEVELGKLAQQKAASAQVKDFGARMERDHGKANDDLKALASQKGLRLPTSIDAEHQRKMQKMQQLSGTAFDRAYMKDMVADHKKDVSEFRKQSRTAKDPDVKVFANKTLPTLEEHLQLAQGTQQGSKNAKR